VGREQGHRVGHGERATMTRTRKTTRAELV
jgi:hypothetical protein